MVTGTEGWPGLSELAFCPEAALVTLDTRAGEGGVWLTRDSIMRAGQMLALWKDPVASAPQDNISYL